MNFETMSEKELRDHLLTCDYKGKEFKTQALDELLKRAEQRGMSLAYLASIGAGPD
jgi:23S rRNA pseudoU1915 N3-methylase RlmH